MIRAILAAPMFPVDPGTAAAFILQGRRKSKWMSAITGKGFLDDSFKAGIAA
jgi:hypothetical protein